MDSPRTSLAVGDYEAHLFFDGVYTAPITDLAHAEDPARRETAIARWGDPNFSIDVNCFGLSGRDGLVLVDAGTGEHWGPAYGKAPAAMRAAGFEPEHVGTVLLTHIHGDHALGLIDVDRALYPEAAVYLPRAEADYYGDASRFEKVPEGCRTLERLRQAYGPRLKLIDAGPVLTGIEAIALPGHTPGHTGYLVESGGEKLFLWGDTVHIDSLQLADPLLGFGYDIDLQNGSRSRRWALETASREGWHIGGGHVRGFRRIGHDDGGFVFR